MEFCDDKKKFITIKGKKIPFILLKKSKIINSVKTINNDFDKFNARNSTREPLEIMDDEHKSSVSTTIVNLKRKRNRRRKCPVALKTVDSHEKTSKDNQPPELSIQLKQYNDPIENNMCMSPRDDYIDNFCISYNNYGYMPVHMSILENNLEKIVKEIQLLLHKNFEVDQPTKKMSYSPLQLAIINECSYNIVDLLLERSDNIFSRDIENKNVLHHCISSDNHNYLYQLLCFTCQNIKKVLNGELNNRDDLREEISNVLYYSEGASLYWLLRHLYTTVDINGYTPIMQCVSEMKIIHLNQFLMYILPKPMRDYVINFQNPSSGKTALYVLVENNLDKPLTPELTHLINILLSYGADPKIKNFAGFNTLNIAFLNKKLYDHLIHFQ